jgi:hypothetical protein
VGLLDMDVVGSEREFFPQSLRDCQQEISPVIYATYRSCQHCVRSDLRVVQVLFDRGSGS